MGKPIRQRVCQAVQEGLSCRQAATRFKNSLSLHTGGYWRVGCGRSQWRTCLCPPVLESRPGRVALRFHSPFCPTFRFFPDNEDFKLC